MSGPKTGEWSPWGRIDQVKILAEGITSVSTSSHGGIHLSPALNAAMPEALRGESGWYEEDDEWANVALAYPHAFDESAQASAHATVKNWRPDAYESWSGIALQPGESRKKDERAFLEAHASDWLVTSAFGSWHDSVPKEWVGVYARSGAFVEAWSSATPERAFLVKEADYDARFNTFGMFICDPTKHPAWDPDKPKDQQTLEVAPQMVDEDEEKERPRP